MAHSINIYLDSFKNIYLIYGYANFYIKFKSNTLPFNIENSGVQWTTLYILLQTRQGCYASFCLHFTLWCGLEKKLLLNKVRKPNGYVHIMPYVRSILILSLFFSVVLIFSLSTSKSWKTFFLVKLHTEFHPFIFFSFLLLVEAKYTLIHVSYKVCS